MSLVVRKHNANRYRSGLEKVVAEYLKQNKKNFRYEDLKIEWKDLRYRTYTPDFILDNGIIVETKGIFDNEDRRKHLAVREQHPELDIRLVFSNAKAKLYKGSKTTYALWCEKNHFLYSHRVIPPDWLEEKGKAVKTKRIKLKVGS
jgi:hypothetical protein